MAIPLQVTFHGVEPSDAVEERVRQKVTKLEQFFDKIVSCRVVVERHHKTASIETHKSEPFHIRIELSVPGDLLVVSRDPKDSHDHEDVTIALRDAFETMERRLKSYVEKLRGDVKNHD